MMVSALVALAASTAAVQPADPSRAPREAYTACLRQFMARGVRERMAENAFNQALPQQCSAEERAFRDSILAREQGYQTPAAEVEQIATEELNDARTNIRELYAMSTTPR